MQKHSKHPSIFKAIWVCCLLAITSAESASASERLSSLTSESLIHLARVAGALPAAEAKKSFTSTQRPARKKRLLRKPDVIYYPTPPETVAEMLRLANVKKGDVLYDLGSGDGRIPIAAAEQYGIRAVGIEIDSRLVAEAEQKARQANVSGLVRFRNEDMFRVDLSEASVVTLYLSEKINVLLRPKLLRELRPGSRILSHDFRMGDWKPEQTIRVSWGKLYRTVYLWIVPPPKGVRKRSI